jgi:N-acetylmuramoyl-L-alanine amidase
LIFGIEPFFQLLQHTHGRSNTPRGRWVLREDVHRLSRRLLQSATGRVLMTLLLLMMQVSADAGVAVNDIRLSYLNGVTRVVFDLSGPVEHRLFPLDDPERVVVDLDDAQMGQAAQGFDLIPSVVQNIRHAPRNLTDLRVVLDLSQHASLKSFLLPPTAGYGHRLVVDLSHAGKVAPVIVADNAEDGTIPLRDVVVAIDAGHGGKDPGAIGYYGTMEKNVVLAVARELEELVAQEPGMRPVMIREADVYLPLRERIDRARQHKADLFVSIHADAAYSSSAHGSSVYVLSSTGASSEAARWLAERENAADFIGGVSLDDKDETLARVLMDLSQSATIEASIALADEILDALQAVSPAHSEEVGQAGFAVLTSPDIPSVLVETAYISNPTDEKNLGSAAYRESMALAVLSGVREFFLDHPPPGTLLAKIRRERHIIRDGETLSAIAERYRVNVDRLRSHNALENDTLHVGQVLLIPTSGG